MTYENAPNLIGTKVLMETDELNGIPKVTQQLMMVRMLHIRDWEWKFCIV